MCEVVKEAKTQARTKPQPWIVRKLMVAFVVGLLGFSAYVYIGRFCLLLIRGDVRSYTGRNGGIALLVTFCILLLWTTWAYLKVVITSPGYARDHVSKCPRPLLPPANPRSAHRPSLSYSLADPERQSVSNMSHNQHHMTSTLSPTLAGPSYEQIPGTTGAKSSPATTSADTHVAPPVVKPTEESPHSWPPPFTTLHPAQATQTKQKPPSRRHPSSVSTADVPLAYAKGGPPTTAILLPAHRYCSRDEFVKPHRAHHCRLCGTCVLKYDHHCPWIGQCVGARNHKFFINFNQATVLFTAYIFSTLLSHVVIGMRDPQFDLDPTQLALLPLTGLFFIFTATLLGSHIWMIMHGQTTVEQLDISAVKERIKYGSVKGYAGDDDEKAGGGCMALPDTKALRAFTEEWGRPETEGHIWWLGNARREWEDVMGVSPLGWFLPIGRSLSDGVTYPVNPRFDSEGRWRKRSEWPEELRGTEKQTRTSR